MIEKTKAIEELPQYGESAGTQNIVGDILKDGTPDWVRFPNDYKDMAKEDFLRNKEISDSMTQAYQLPDQALLSQERGQRHWIGSREFIDKLRNNGVNCWTHYNGLENTVGLWVIKPTFDGGQPAYICYMQIPSMPEWSVLKLGPHNEPLGEKLRGARTVIWRLVEEGILTETKAHEIFGAPSENIFSMKYRRSMHALRNRLGRFSKLK